MAVTIEELARSLRVGSTPQEVAELAKLLEVATVLVDQYAPLAPTVVLDQAIKQVCGFLYDKPTVQRSASAAVLTNSEGRLSY